MSDVTFEFQENGMVVGLPGGHAYFNYYWLRDACVSCIDPQTRERVFDTSELSSSPRATSAHVDGDMVVIGWQDEAQASHVPIALLEEVAAKGRVDDPADIPRNLWYNDHLPDIIRVSQQAVTDTNEGRARLSRALIEDGIAIVNDMEHSTESLQGLTVPTTTRANELDEGFIAVRQPASTEKAGGVLSEVVRL